MNALASLVPPPYSLSSRVSFQSSFRNNIYGRSTFTFEAVDHLLRKPSVNVEYTPQLRKVSLFAT